MSYIGKNPKVKTVVLDDVGVASQTNPAAGSHKLVNRNGVFNVLDSAGVESALGGGATTVKVSQVAHGFTVGQVFYASGANTYALAKADAANTAEVVGMVSKVINVDSFEMTTAGLVTGLSGLTVNEVYYLSPTVSGGITATEPSTIGHVSKPIGVAASATSLVVTPSRGAVVGGTNARTSLTLANNTVNNVQSVAAYDAGELTGWVSIAATTPLKFYVSAPFAKNGAGTDWNVSPSYMGDTPPAGFSITVTSAGLIQLTLPSIAGFAQASINYSLNAPAVGATFPLSIDAGTISTGTIGSARLPAGQYPGGTSTTTSGNVGYWLRATNTTFVNQASPVQNTGYDQGPTLVVPEGNWLISWMSLPQALKSSGTFDTIITTQIRDSANVVLATCKCIGPHNSPLDLLIPLSGTFVLNIPATTTRTLKFTNFVGQSGGANTYSGLAMRADLGDVYIQAIRLP